MDPLEIARNNRYGRVIYEGDPRAPEYLSAAKEVESIRSDLASIRRRLDRLQDVETEFWFDSDAVKCAGTLTVLIRMLYDLCDGGTRSFQRRAERNDELWADIRAHPARYVLRPGTGREARGR